MQTTFKVFILLILATFFVPATVVHPQSTVNNSAHNFNPTHLDLKPAELDAQILRDMSALKLSGPQEKYYGGGGAVFTVNDTTDAADASPGNGICASSGGKCTLRAAIQEASVLSGNTLITLPAGVYYLTLGDLHITGNLTLNGNSASTTFIDGNQIDRVFEIQASGDATISQVTIQNGKRYYSGGGIANYGVLALANCTIRNNTAIGNTGAPEAVGASSYGGGIHNIGDLTVNACLIENNEVIGGKGGSDSNSDGWGGNGGNAYGGGIYNTFGHTMVVEESSVSSNKATGGNGGGSIAMTGGSGYGGGIYNAGTLTANYSFVSYNDATGGGGVIDGGPAFGGGIANYGRLTLYASGVNVNEAIGKSTGDNGGYGSGGGIFNASSDPVDITYSTIRYNSAIGGIGGFCFSASASGGGIYNSSGAVTMFNTFVGDNVATGANNNTTHCANAGSAYGGGILNADTLTLNNVTLSQNIANGGSYTGISSSGKGGVGEGGAIYNVPSQTLVVNNNTLYKNQANGGSIATVGTAGVGDGQSIKSSGGLTIKNSIVAGTTGKAECSGSLTSAGYNLSSDFSCSFSSVGDKVNINPMLGALQNNGGPTSTYALLSNSPALDAGNPTTPGSSGNSCLVIDQRGAPRPADGNDDNTAVCDIGAFEVTPLPGVPTLNQIANSDNDGNYTISWTTSSHATSYELQYQKDNGTWFNLLKANVTSHTVTDQSEGTWCYRVRGANYTGVNNTSSWSNTSCTTVQATTAQTWTYMLYFAGDTGAIDNGNVHAALARAIQRLEENPNPNVNLVVLLDGPGTVDTFRITFSPQADYVPVGEKRMDDPTTLVQFVQQAQADFPADHYYLSIADHANGVQGIAWDTTTNPNRSALLTPSEIRQALATITSNGSQPLDIIHFDGCSFGLLENAVIAQDFVRYMVVSQNIGWSVFAYDDYRDAVSDNSLPADLAVAIAQRYMEEVGQQQHPYTISAIDLSRLSPALSALDLFSDALTDFALVNQSNRTALANIRSQSQKFDSGGEAYLTIDDEDSYIDLVDFATRAKLQLTTHNIPTLANNLVEAITGSQPLVVYEAHRSGSFDYFGSNFSWNLDGAHGISLYYPKRAAGAMYGDYTSGATFPNFYSQVNWHAYLQAGVPPLAPGEPLPDDQPSPLPPLDLLRYRLFLPSITK